MPDLDQRVAIVTGAAMGIGRASALALARAGAAVLVADVDEEAGAQARADIEAEGGRAIFLRTDVRSFADAEACTAAAIEAWGKVDILVNNAARAIGGVVDEIDEASWNEVLSTNLTSVWRFIRCVAPHMRRQGGGSIVNISSVQALRGFHGWAAYAAAKGGINALTQQAAVDLAPARIRVNAVAPGTIMTPLNEKVFREAADPQELIDRWNAAHPLGRFGEAEEVAETVLFLASDRSSFITGEIIRVDGGLAIKGD
ncbi:SDR family NAD(P)-dependent oxidoreductase [Labrys monachus]|uniref:NAD(P)-dependent dehydrogenase (Short-subunit alcohol dehydrogenase family) n=1 Tax=Labrys monachus TaxID=217067 RepID=A0ABU0F9Z1_9HYPH|nr:glucose 1-dehydrogenase [Labrys monachus]MDQ0391429.1 NAD(P)-dependent dehydrogenase (short-subunit alcohol dehydrogenase family) [Labrys monachus]